MPDWVDADGSAKTGQSLIANSIFDSLPSAPVTTTSTTTTADDSMQVDPAPALSTMERVDKSSEPTSHSSAGNGRKYSPPLDAQTGDLIPEGVIYLRLLLALMNLDAGKVEEVSFSV